MDYNTWTARDSDGITLHMFLGKSFDISDDGRVYTNKMRKGLRWSDGSPFSMEDVRFAWEDHNLNAEITPVIHAEYRDAITGNPVKFAVVDEDTWTLTFDTANFALYELRSTQRQWCSKGLVTYMCPSYLKQFHADYADPVELQAMIKAGDLENWTQLYSSKGNIFANVDLPHMTPWGACVKEDAQFRVCRNHYYSFFDPEGNQLPYVDEFEVNTHNWNREVAVFRAMNGENDVRGDMLVLSEMPLYNANIEKGDFSLFLWPDAGGLDLAINMNLSYNKDPEIGRLLRTRDFRIALSLALDRDELNESLFLGVGIIQNLAPHPSTPYYPGDAVAQLNIQYDMDRANALLDTILPDKDSQGFRLRTDNGERLVLQAVLPSAGFAAPYDPLMDLVQPMWEDVGIELIYRISGNATSDYDNGDEYLSQRNGMSFYQANLWALEGGLTACKVNCLQAPAIGIHLQTMGERGMGIGPDLAYLPLAPPDTYAADVSGNIKRAQELFAEGKAYTRFDPRRIEIGKELVTMWAEEMYALPIAAFTGSFRGMQMKRNNLLNVPRHHTSATSGYRTDTYFFENGMDNKHHPGNRSKLFQGTTFLGGR
jgi:peptide/nickel transport system substrate-binding protein